MKKFNLSKSAANKNYKAYDKMLEERTKEMNLDNQDLSTIAVRLPEKGKDNTVPYEKQIDADRDGKDNLIVTEQALNDKPKVFNDKRQDEWDTNVLPVNLETEKHNQEHLKSFRKAENKDKDSTAFWDKYVGVEMLGEKTEVKDNIKATQLEDLAERFKGLKDATDVELKEMVSASLKDADAMLFHIQATANKESRDLSSEEKQMIIDINGGKVGLINKAMGILNKRADNSQILIKQEGNGSVVYENGVPIDKFNSSNEAKMNYPEAEITR